MPKLTDTQCAILAAAAHRAGGAALPLPSSLKIKGGAVSTTLESLRKKGLLEEKPATADTAAWREAKDGRRLMLVLTGAGRQALAAGPDKGSSKPTAAAKPRANKPGKRAERKPAAKSKGKTAPPNARAGTKQALLIELLERKDGATIAEIVKATGWQPHSVRGAISGSLKKKLGLAVISAAVEGRGRVYRIAARG